MEKYKLDLVELRDSIYNRETNSLDYNRLRSFEKDDDDEKRGEDKGFLSVCTSHSSCILRVLQSTHPIITLLALFIGPRYTWGPIYGSESLSLYLCDSS